MQTTSQYFMRDQVRNRVRNIMARDAHSAMLGTPSLLAFLVLLMVFNVIALVPNP